MTLKNLMAAVLLLSSTSFADFTPTLYEYHPVQAAEKNDCLKYGSLKKRRGCFYYVRERVRKNLTEQCEKMGVPGQALPSLVSSIYDPSTYSSVRMSCTRVLLHSKNGESSEVCSAVCEVRFQ